MRHIDQGGQHVLLLSDAEYRALRHMAGNGAGDAPDQLAMAPKLWNMLSRWAFADRLPEDHPHA